MTVSSTATRWAYTGDNSTVNFAYNNKIFLSADLDVYLNGVLQTETTHYTVSGAGNEGGGTVTFVTPPPTASSVIIVRDMALTQETDIPNGGILLSNALENEFDRSRIADQQINEIAGRALKYPVTDQAVKKYDAEGLVIENVADGVAANDAVNKGQMDVAVTAAAGGVLPETILQTVATLAELTSIQKASLADGDRRDVTSIVDGWAATAAGVPIGGFLAVWNASSTAAVDGATVFSADEGGVGRWLQSKVEINVEDFASLIVSKPDPADPSTWDWTPAYNGAIAHAAIKGGGVVNSSPATRYIASSIFLVSRVELHGIGTHLVGSGSNIIFETGWLNGTVTESNTAEYGTGHTGNGTHYVDRAKVIGVRTSNCNMGARLHRFNYASELNGCILTGSTYSVFSTHGWGQRYIGNFITAPMRLQDFVDWTVIESNSFEFCLGYALIIGHPTGETAYGGTWTCRIHNNGFHHTKSPAGVADQGTAIWLRMEVDNMEIKGNHFESQTKHIVGDIRTCRKLTITNNHLAATVPNVEAITFVALLNSTIEKNDYVISASGSYTHHVSLNTTGTYGNYVEIPFSPTTNTPDLSKYILTDANYFINRFASNNASLTQPMMETLSGSGNYTYEKYRAKYRNITGQIPLCTIVYGTNQITVDTFIASDTYGALQPFFFAFTIGGATTSYRSSGIVAGLTLTSTSNIILAGTGSPATVTVSNNAGFVRLVFSGLVDDANNMSGFVKAI